MQNSLKMARTLRPSRGLRAVALLLPLLSLLLLTDALPAASAKIPSLVRGRGRSAPASSTTPTGNAPFAPVYLQQPVQGAARGVDPEGWKVGKICDITKSPYNAVGDGQTLNTNALQAAIDDCGDLADGLGGTVLVPAHSGVFLTGSLWLRSNMTFRVEENATIQYPSLSIEDR